MSEPRVVLYATSVPTLQKVRADIATIKRILEGKKVAYEEVGADLRPSALAAARCSARGGAAVCACCRAAAGAAAIADCSPAAAPARWT